MGSKACLTRCTFCHLIQVTDEKQGMEKCVACGYNFFNWDSGYMAKAIPTELYIRNIGVKNKSEREAIEFVFSTNCLRRKYIKA